MSALVLSLGLCLLGPSSGERWRPPELAVAPTAADAAALLATARSYLGRSYRMGGTGEPDFDCSGFTCRVYAESGYGIPRVSRDQAGVGADVPLDGLAPGDLLFFVGEPGESRITHVGLYAGAGQMIHASSGEGAVVVADLDRRWYRERLVRARRILGEVAVDTSTQAVALGVTRELIEHPSGLPPMLRLPSRPLPRSLGPALPSATRGTTLGVRALGATERGEFGFVLAPEVKLVFPSIALELEVAAPIRFPLDGPPTLGEFTSAREVLRFVRTLSLGLRGADLALRFGRDGDVWLGAGGLVAGLPPAPAAGLVGLSIDPGALLFTGGLRVGDLHVELALDDVAEPGLGAAAIGYELVPGLEAFAVAASDQGGRLGAARRALNGLELGLRYAPIANRRFHLEVGALGVSTRALGELAFAGAGFASAELRFAGGQTRLGLDLAGGYAGPGALLGLFGPTYPAERAAHAAALARATGRAVFEGGLSLSSGRLTVVARYADAVDGDPFDRRLSALVELGGLHLGADRWLSLRGAYSARALGAPERIDVLHAAASLRLWSIVELSAFVEESDRIELGLGAAVAWSP